MTRGRERVDQGFERSTGRVGGARGSRSPAAAAQGCDRERPARHREHGDRPPSSDERRRRQEGVHAAADRVLQRRGDVLPDQPLDRGDDVGTDQTSGDRFGRWDSERGIVGQPPHARVVDLDPRVRIGLADLEVPCERIALPRSVPGHDPRRDALRAEQHGHRARDVLAEAPMRLEQEVIDRVDARGLTQDR